MAPVPPPTRRCAPDRTRTSPRGRRSLYRVFREYRRFRVGCPSSQVDKTWLSRELYGTITEPFNKLKMEIEDGKNLLSNDFRYKRSISNELCFQDIFAWDLIIKVLLSCRSEELRKKIFNKICVTEGLSSNSWIFLGMNWRRNSTNSTNTLWVVTCTMSSCLRTTKNRRRCMPKTPTTWLVEVVSHCRQTELGNSTLYGWSREPVRKAKTVPPWRPASSRYIHKFWRTKYSPRIASTA